MATALVLLLPGCVGLFGERVFVRNGMVEADLDASFDIANETRAFSAVAAMGFSPGGMHWNGTYTGHEPDGFIVHRGNEEWHVFPKWTNPPPVPDTPHLGVRYFLDEGEKEFDGCRTAEAGSRDVAKQTLARFNATFADFHARTGFSLTAAPGASAPFSEC